jgi:rhodanese-related sulfurtransferase
MANSVPLVSVQELHRQLAAGEPLTLIDVRTPAEFGAAHEPAARNVPLGSPELTQLARAAVANARTVLVICESGGRSRRCCEELLATGAKVLSVEGGTAAWRAAGFPVEQSSSGRRVISLERQVRIAAGALVVIGCALAWQIHVGFLGLAAFIGAGLVFAGVTDFCGMGLVLAKMPWNRR